MKTQGNWGDSSKDIQPSADRYIGGMISDTALSLLCDSIEYCNYITGELDKPEPEALPTLLPLCFINGQQGIPSGLPKLNIPCLDIEGLFEYYMAVLKAKDLDFQPKKLPIPNIGCDILSSVKEWEEVLKTGKGSIRVAPKMSIDKDGTIVITALPASKNVDHVRKIIEKEILLDKADIRDESTYETRIVIEKVYKKQCNMQELFKRLYAKLQTTESYNMAFFDQNHIYVPAALHSVVKANLQFLIDTHHNRLRMQIKEASGKLEVLQIIEKLKKTNNWKNIFDLSYNDAVEYLVNKFGCENEIAQNVFKKPISYLTREHAQEILELQQFIQELQIDQADIYDMLLQKYKTLKSKMLKEINKNVTIFINK
jgi:DNA gyrase/topoisomerase IV subunit A